MGNNEFDHPNGRDRVDLLSRLEGAMPHRLACCLLLAITSGFALADQPLPPPAAHTVCSASKTFCATSDPGRATTIVAASTDKTPLWTIPGWHRWLFVSDDGVSVVVAYEGMNLVPRDVTLDEPVLFFHHRGKLVRTVTLGDLYERVSDMTPTVSHRHWATIRGFNASNQLALDLVNGKRVAFSASTGLSEASTTEKKP